LVLYGSCAGSTFSANSGTTEWNYDDTSLDCASQRGAQNPGGTTGPTSTVSSSDSWLAIGASLKAASAGGSIVPILMRQFRTRWFVLFILVLFSVLAAPPIAFGREASDESMERVLDAGRGGRNDRVYSKVRNGSGESGDSVHKE
jgi:hypothetical protein